MEYLREDVNPNTGLYPDGTYSWMTVRAGGSGNKLGNLELNKAPVTGTATQQAYQLYEGSGIPHINPITTPTEFQALLVTNAGVRGTMQTLDPATNTYESPSDRNALVPNLGRTVATEDFLGFLIENIFSDTYPNLANNGLELSVNVSGSLTNGNSPATLQMHVSVEDDDGSFKTTCIGTYNEDFPADAGGAVGIDANFLAVLPKIEGFDESKAKFIILKFTTDIAGCAVSVRDASLKCKYIPAQQEVVRVVP